MAQTRIADTLKAFKGFSLVAKAFGDAQCAEATKILSNSSLRGIVQDVQNRAEDVVSDAMVFSAQVQCNGQNTYF